MCSISFALRKDWSGYGEVPPGFFILDSAAMTPDYISESSRFFVAGAILTFILIVCLRNSLVAFQFQEPLG